MSIGFGLAFWGRFDIVGLRRGRFNNVLGLGGGMGLMWDHLPFCLNYALIR